MLWTAVSWLAKTSPDGASKHKGIDSLAPRKLVAPLGFVHGAQPFVIPIPQIHLIGSKMGAMKEMMLQREGMSGVAEEVAIAAGLGERCAMHEGVFISEFPDEDLLVKAYKIANARITNGEIALPSMMDRREFTDLTKEVVEQAPDFCPECDRLFGKDD